MLKRINAVFFFFSFFNLFMQFFFLWFWRNESIKAGIRRHDIHEIRLFLRFPVVIIIRPACLEKKNLFVKMGFYLKAT